MAEPVNNNSKVGLVGAMAVFMFGSIGVSYNMVTTSVQPLQHSQTSMQKQLDRHISNFSADNIRKRTNTAKFTKLEMKFHEMGKQMQGLCLLIYKDIGELRTKENLSLNINPCSIIERGFNQL